MDIPPPSAPDSQLADWRQTDRTVDSPFTTPLVSAHTHTLVYEETSQRAQIRAATDIDQPWRFFFASRIRLDPPKRPSSLLTTLIRRKVTAAFVDRLSERGFEGIHKSNTKKVTIGGNEGVRYRYQARCRLDTDGVTLPVESYLAIWADDDYHVAGGAFPIGLPTNGPSELNTALRDVIDSDAARKELFALIDGCGDS